LAGVPALLLEVYSLDAAEWLAVQRQAQAPRQRRIEHLRRSMPHDRPPLVAEPHPVCRCPGTLQPADPAPGTPGHNPDRAAEAPGLEPARAERALVIARRTGEGRNAPRGLAVLAVGRDDIAAGICGGCEQPTAVGAEVEGPDLFGAVLDELAQK